MDQLPTGLLLFLGIALGAIAGAVVMWIRDRLALRSAVAIASRRSVDQSRRTLKGQIAEQMAPLLGGFPYDPADARFLGDPIDYVIFNGYTDVKDDGADPDCVEVVILDVKRGPGAKLSPTQRAISRAVASGRVRFEVLKIEGGSAEGRVELPGIKASTHPVPTRRPTARG